MRCEVTLSNTQPSPPTTLRVVPPPRAGEGLEFAGGPELRLSLPVSGKGDRPKAGGWGLRQRVKNGLQDAVQIVVDIAVPESQDAKTSADEFHITRDVTRPTVLASVNFNDKSRRQAGEIQYVAEPRNLPPEVDCAFLSPSAETDPQRDFLLRHPSFSNDARACSPSRVPTHHAARGPPSPCRGGIGVCCTPERPELRLSLPRMGRGDGRRPVGGEPRRTSKRSAARRAPHHERPRLPRPEGRRRRRAAVHIFAAGVHRALRLHQRGPLVPVSAAGVHAEMVRRRLAAQRYLRRAPSFGAGRNLRHYRRADPRDTCGGGAGAVAVLRPRLDLAAVRAAIALPGIVTGISLRAAFALADVPFSFWTIVAGHATFCIVVVYNNAVARFRRLSPSLVEASMDLGADGFRPSPVSSCPTSPPPCSRRHARLRAVVRRGHRHDFTAGQQTTLPIWMLTELVRPRQRPVTNVVAVFVIVITFLPILAAYYLTQSGEQTAGSGK